MLKLYRLMCLTVLIFTVSVSAKESQTAVKIDTKIKNESEQKKPTVFNIEDNTTKFKVDPAELNQIKSMDIQAVKEKIEMMRDKVLDSKSRLMEVSKDEFSSIVPISYVSVIHKNEMSSRFNIVSLKYMLDGQNIFSYYDSNNANKNTYSVFSSFVAPGHHEVIVEAIVSGRSSGIFDYLKDYRIKVQGRYPFIAPDKKKTSISAISYEKGGIFTSFKDRPGIKFNMVTDDSIAEKIEK